MTTYFDKNGVALKGGEQVIVNGKPYVVGFNLENGERTLITRDGKIRVQNLDNAVYGGRSNWFVDPARLMVIK